MEAVIVNGHTVRALTIAGSDSGGGAGIQADLKTMHQFGVYGMSVVTAVTAQNTLGVQGVHELDAEFVQMQMDSVLDDIGTDAAKTGMLANESIIHAVVDGLEKHAVPYLVVDPVMVAKGGAPLISPEAIDALRERLVPRADVITPNIPEASVLCGHPLETWDEYHRAAEQLAKAGAQTVVIKGGHMSPFQSTSTPWGRNIIDPVSVDIVFCNGDYTYFLTKRIDTRKTHGTGCTYSAAITSMLARGYSVLDAIAVAKAFIFQAIEGAKDWDVGQGHGPTDHFANVPLGSSVEPGGAYLCDGLPWVRLDQ
ncbi:bifunctional hydroxymethylpyrimidine kinase/phosphomethylpyrimidine kinase [Alicyclobacillus dauci]|uniref:Hydroxymethylpyrimidine/phosphomethylpyrimidine kinase n=1 Tax=Alicyclobacillus dauci TaxID=1475485 RepID=A0ABY6Z9N7_9BACL|nr:bifunctional hydroxymethylpyrimidine kinase/phosphomethylpyrimidine kinase [Alicyclobacillus dauci]WAH39262.1 bifunctional hydroxymethylpyrimidine kinase/phosphomethylpyrimidine kinase [Alicyclobacillus dauci]